jgi:hypothetical protein
MVASLTFAMIFLGKMVRYIRYNGGQPDPPWEDGQLYPLLWWPASPLLGSSLGRWSTKSAKMVASLTFARILLE